MVRLYAIGGIKRSIEAMPATQSSSPHRFTVNPRRPNQVRKSCRHPSRYRPTNSGPHAFSVVRQNRSAIAPLLAARTIRGVWNSRANSDREGNIRSFLVGSKNPRVPTGHAGTDLACARSALCANNSADGLAHPHLKFRVLGEQTICRGARVPDLLNAQGGIPRARFASNNRQRV